VTYANVTATLALVFALSGGAYAALGGIPNSAGVFHGCVNRRMGALRVVRDARSCRAAKTVKRGHKRIRIPGELPVAWNQAGKRGQPGTNGEPGAAGTARSYGFVTLPCTVGGTCTLSQAHNATVTHPFAGVFCIEFPGVDVTTMTIVASLADGLADEFIGTPVGGSCSPDGLEVVTRDSAGNQDFAFSFAVP
jgi:hypothetical protein